MSGVGPGRRAGLPTESALSCSLTCKGLWLPSRPWRR